MNRTGSYIRTPAVLILLSFLLVMFMTGCGEYASSYKAVGFVHSNSRSSANMTFYSLEGRMVFKLKPSAEGDIKYTASLETGSATVYYDYAGVKSELFSISGGEDIEGAGGYIEAGTVYIIVETDGKCQNGAFRFDLE